MHVLRVRPCIRRRFGAGMTEWIVIVTLVAILCLGVVTVFGQRIARRLKGASASLDEGKPKSGMEYVPPANIGTVGPAPVLANAPSNASTVTTAPPANTMTSAGSVPRLPDNTPVYGGGTMANLSGYDPAAILADMTQVDQNPATANDNVRCVIASYTAAAVMAGPGALTRLADDLALRIQNGTTPVGPNGGTLPDAQAIAALGRIRDRIESGNFDYRDLGMLQQLIYEHYGGGATGTTFAQQLNLTGLGGSVDPAGNPIGAPNSGNNQIQFLNRAALVTAANGLGPGQSFVVGINEFPGGGTNSDHGILIGRDPSGRLYLYNPWPHANPAGGQPPPQLVYYDQNPAVFDHHLDQYAPGAGFDVGSPIRF